MSEWAGWISRVATRTDDFFELVGQLPEVERTDWARWSTFKVRGHPFGYLWERTQTVGLKQTLSEQLALVAERPETFEIQFTAGQFGWVVVYLERVDRTELAELTTRPGRLTAPDTLVQSTHELPQCSRPADRPLSRR